MEGKEWPKLLNLDPLGIFGFKFSVITRGYVTLKISLNQFFPWKKTGKNFDPGPISRNNLDHYQGDLPYFQLKKVIRESNDDGDDDEIILLLNLLWSA